MGFGDGTICNILICLSQAKRNGWETWFSCEMAAKMKQLITPGKGLDFQPLETIFKVFKDNKKALAEAEKKLAATDASKPAQAKYLAARQGEVNEKRQLAEILKSLC